MRDSRLTLIVETPSGTLVRRVPDATPLPDAPLQGYAAEEATRNAAATWGLPDFVFRPKQQRSGSSVRELGDGLLVVGRRAAVLQSRQACARGGVHVESLPKRRHASICSRRGPVRLAGWSPPRCVLTS